MPILEWYFSIFLCPLELSLSKQGGRGRKGAGSGHLQRVVHSLLSPASSLGLQPLGTCLVPPAPWALYGFEHGFRWCHSASVVLSRLGTLGRCRGGECKPPLLPSAGHPRTEGGRERAEAGLRRSLQQLSLSLLGPRVSLCEYRQTHQAIGRFPGQCSLPFSLQGPPLSPKDDCFLLVLLPLPPFRDRVLGACHYQSPHWMAQDPSCL